MNETKDEKNKEEWNKYNENIFKSFVNLVLIIVFYNN